MLYIDPSSSEIESAKNTHFEHIKCLILKKINEISYIKKNVICKCSICESRIKKVEFKSPETIKNQIKDFLTKEHILDSIITGSPQNLYDINLEFWKTLEPKFNFNDWSSLKEKEPIKSIMTDVKKIFDYEGIFKNKESKHYNAYNLATNLNRNTCTYCNRVYTSTIINHNGKKIMRPTLDHWFPKSDFPLLALSFYNLIPACTNCNSSVKGTSNFNLKEHIHPYIDKTQTNDFSFNYKFYKKLNNYSIHLEETNPNSTKARKTLEAMYIDEMYNSHQSEIDDLIKIKTNYSENYIQSIQDLFQHKLTKEEIYRILFGVEYDSEDFHKLPLSKFKNDILKDLKIK